MSDKFELTHQGTKVAIAREVDGIDMGVLDDGTAYVTGRGLARLCGVVASAIISQKDEWAANRRSGKLAKMLVERGFNEAALAKDIIEDGRQANAYGEVVVMTFLEYYAFEAQNKSPVALSTYRQLARAGLRFFVYSALGYDPAKIAAEKWRQFHDRVQLHLVPAGHFSVFGESSPIIVSAIQNGMVADHNTVPDISIGKLWSAHWTDNNLEEQYGPRKKADHNYPDYFPQSRSNPQPMFIYPLASLGVFRLWMQDVYIPEKFGTYLKGKVKKGDMDEGTASKLLSAAQPLALPTK
jgi:hypothetical protein